MKLFPLTLTLISCLYFSACETGAGLDTKSEAELALQAAREKVATNATHHYRYVSFWDNRFASSTYSDSMRITYSRLPDGERGFGYLAAGPDYTYLYDGKDHLKVDHQRRKTVRTTAAEIAGDATFFDHKMYFMATPRELPPLEELDALGDTILDGQRRFFYRTSELKAGADGPITTSRTYYIDPETDLLVRVRRVSHRGGDTSQVIDHYLEDYSFDPAPYNFTDNDRRGSLAYREVSSVRAEEEQRAGLVKAGERLSRADYTDRLGQERLLYGRPGRQSVVMFGFIGCGACESVLRAMKNKAYAVREELQLYYSSPVDKSAALESYLSRKAFPHPAFGKESKMNQNFGWRPSRPSFLSTRRASLKGFTAGTMRKWSGAYSVVNDYWLDAEGALPLPQPAHRLVPGVGPELGE